MALIESEFRKREKFVSSKKIAPTDFSAISKVSSPAAGKNRGVACFSLLSMEERRRRGCLLTPLTKLHLPVHTFQPIKLK